METWEELSRRKTPAPKQLPPGFRRLNPGGSTLQCLLTFSAVHRSKVLPHQPCLHLISQDCRVYLNLKNNYEGNRNCQEFFTLQEERTKGTHERQGPFLSYSISTAAGKHPEKDTILPTHSPLVPCLGGRRIAVLQVPSHLEPLVMLRVPVHLVQGTGQGKERRPLLNALTDALWLDELQQAADGVPSPASQHEQKEPAVAVSPDGCGYSLLCRQRERVCAGL
ncbi:hypothetical protein P7K49_010013 [Saguinus oedipus]|uniref:Uncharacterized protein n=1 Tax=Saguinus oedipus TaxID=9490 RepID=A0ABQ9VLK9_SAGOE|nr:hypothetical protein P7K49_010013 [Saguinus oedipus]